MIDKEKEIIDDAVKSAIEKTWERMRVCDQVRMKDHLAMINDFENFQNFEHSKYDWDEEVGKKWEDLKKFWLDRKSLLFSKQHKRLFYQEKA